MRFPGSKLLHEWDLSLQRLSLDDLFQSCRQVRLTGIAEIKLPSAAGMIFYYLGGEVNAVYRKGASAVNGQDAVERLREGVAAAEGTISVFELPLDMAHVLRGASNRRRHPEPIGTPADLAGLLRELEGAEHTGTLEIGTKDGAAMVLLVRGRVSNVYWEERQGLTFEKAEGRKRLEAALAGEAVMVYVSDFSRDAWRLRHEIQSLPHKGVARITMATATTPAAKLAAEEMRLRGEALDELLSGLPSLVLGIVFDLMTGAVFVRRGPGMSELDVIALSDEIPALARDLRERLITIAPTAPLEFLEIALPRFSILVAVIGDAEEAMAVVADRTQPTALINAGLARAARDYAVSLQTLRQRLTVRERAS